MINNKKRAVKESRSEDHQDMVLLRETEGNSNLQIHYTPEEAIQVGRALVEVGGEIIARREIDPDKTRDPADPRSDV